MCRSMVMERIPASKSCFCRELRSRPASFAAHICPHSHHDGLRFILQTSIASHHIISALIDVQNVLSDFSNTPSDTAIPLHFSKPGSGPTIGSCSQQVSKTFSACRTRLTRHWTARTSPSNSLHKHQTAAASATRPMRSPSRHQVYWTRSTASTSPT